MHREAHTCFKILKGLVLTHMLRIVDSWCTKSELFLPSGSLHFLDSIAVEELLRMPGFCVQKLSYLLEKLAKSLVHVLSTAMRKSGIVWTADSFLRSGLVLS